MADSAGSTKAAASSVRATVVAEAEAEAIAGRAGMAAEEAITAEITGSATTAKAPEAPAK